MRRHERGQVLILGIMALIILLLAIFSLFDVQNLIRGKVKSQSAVDAAAIAGANWQRHTLNLVGELNIVKATTLLIDESLFGTGGNSETFMGVQHRDELPGTDHIQRQKMLSQSSDLISQMQYRALFICPLIGVGAAQTAAKNNGLNSYDNFGRAVSMQNSMLAGVDERSNLYDYFKQDEYCSKFLYGFQWHVPYLNMLTTLLHQKGRSGLGFAVMPSGEMIGAPSLYTDPPSSPDFAKFLGSWSFYDAIRGDDFCYLKEFLLANFSSKWWGNIKVKQNTNFTKESEYLPVRVKIAESSQTAYDLVKDYGVLEELLKRSGKNWTPLGDRYDWKEPEFDDEGNVKSGDDLDTKLNPLPAIDWAFYKEEWIDYNKWVVAHWERYLDGTFKPESTYKSGAVARMDAYFSPKLLFTSRNDGTRHQFSDAVSGYKGTQKYVDSLRTAESILQASPPTIHAYALAKPFGKLKIGKKFAPPHYSSMVLPVFSETALIPVALENPGMNPLANYNWYLYLLNYMPELGKANSLDQIPQDLQSQFRTYHNLLKKADNPSWRQFGIDWLERPLAYDVDGNVTVRQKDRCNYWPSGDGGDCGARNMPATKF